MEFCGIFIKAFAKTFTTRYFPCGGVKWILEDVLRMYVMHEQRNLEEYLPLVEFSYNNASHESWKMSPFKALYQQIYNISIS